MHKNELQSVYRSPYLQSETKSKPWVDPEGGGRGSGPPLKIANYRVNIAILVRIS